MNARRFEWAGAEETAARIRSWAGAEPPTADAAAIEREIVAEGDEALLRLTARFDATESPPAGLLVPREERRAALARLDERLRESLELTIANVGAVAEAQLDGEERRIDLAQGQTVRVREVPVGSAGIYAPGGRAAYPSTVVMCSVPARVAGVGRVVLATPPGPTGEVDPTVLAAAELCRIDDVFAVGGAQAIFALAHGTETIAAVDVVAGPGNAWVREAKRLVCGRVGIDSLAGPSELMAVVGDGADPDWVALDLCAQAEHGADAPLVAVAVEEAVLDAVAAATERASSERAGIGEAPLALVQVPDTSDAIDLANSFAPEHLELLEEDAALLAARVETAGCVFAGRHAATAFGDYVAGSNHVLPTGGAGRFSGPLGPGTFRRRISIVEVPAAAAAKLAPHVDRLARAEGLPVHGESAMIRAEEND
jgi:histidinol dehydrogenase